MANAGTVTVDFAAEVAKFNAQLKEVNNRVKAVESGFKSLEKVAQTALKFFSVGIAVNFIKSAAEAADALGKTADKLGLSTERLAAFQLAAEDAGVSTGTFNKLLTDAQRRLGEAATGTGATFDALQSLGLSVRELQRLSPDELFLRYADSINQLKSRAEQFSVSQDLFGRSAQEAFTLIAAGRPAIDTAAETVDRLGLALSRVDIAKIEVANDKLALLAKASQAFGQQLAASVAPFIADLVDGLTNSGASADSLREKIDKVVAVGYFAFQTLRNGVLALEAAFYLTAAAGAKFLEIQARLPTLGFQNDISRAFAASTEVNLEKAKVSAEGIKTFAQIAESYADIMERAQQRAEATAAAAATANAGLTGESRFEVLQFEFDSELEMRAANAEFLRQFQFDQQRITNEGLEAIELEHLRNVNLERERLTKETEDRIYSMKLATTNAAIGLLSALAGRSKIAALALIAFEKIRAIAQAKINTAVAVTNALANVPYPYNFAAAAQMAQLGAIQIGLIAATGVVEAANVFSSSSGGAPIGSPQNPVFTDTGGRNDEQAFGAQQKNQISITFEGVFTSAAAREIAEQIRDVVENSDVHIIGPNSSNGRELRGV